MRKASPRIPCSSAKECIKIVPNDNVSIMNVRDDLEIDKSRPYSKRDKPKKNGSIRSERLFVFLDVDVFVAD